MVVALLVLPRLIVAVLIVALLVVALLIVAVLILTRLAAGVIPAIVFTARLLAHGFGQFDQTVFIIAARVIGLAGIGLITVGCIIAVITVIALSIAIMLT